MVLMGVSGSGKTTVGRALAQRLEMPFFDADNYHPPENIAKMAGGEPLTDADREPWLEALHQLIHACLEQGKPGILACSALKRGYRRRLDRDQSNKVQYVHLEGSYDVIWERMADRQDHYMRADMLRSQFETLEAPENAITVNVDRSVEEIVEDIMAQLEAEGVKTAPPDLEKPA